MVKNLLVAVCFFVFGTAVSQNLHKKVLFAIDGDPVYASEFLSVYNKNLDLVQDGSQKDLDGYLQMFIDYKLKIKQAKDLGLEDNEKFRKEFNGYRKQLARKYLTDANVTEALVREAYNRTVEEVNAAHILLKVNEDAAPADTLKAYNKALELRRQILDGADFETVAKQFSEDPSVRQNGGQLGWFNAFKMVYPFEDATYRTKKGEISQPVRTNFGYHLILVNDRRKSQGEVTAAHIMISETQNGEEEINRIYDKIQEGEDFEALAKRYSDDKATAVKGGKLNSFTAGKLNSPVFEKIAFGLKNPEDISAPFQTEFGWHIVKLLEKNPIASYAEMKPALEKRVNNDARSRRVTEAFIQELKKEYKIKDNKEAISFFEGYVTNDKLLGKTDTADMDELVGKKLYTIKDSTLTYRDFAEFIFNQKRKPINGKNKAVLIKKWHDDFINAAVLAYHREHLEEANQDFANIVKEYKEGLLIFELMEQEIWNQAKQDTIGLREFYNENRAKYPQDVAFEETKGMVINDYQAHLENQWVQTLRQSANIEVKNRTYKKIKKSLE